MSEENKPAEQKTTWDKVWLEKLSKVDDVIIEFFKDTGDKVEDAFTQVKEKVQSWFDKEDLDDDARAEFEQAKTDQTVFHAQVENRVKELADEGKIPPPPPQA